MIAVHTAQTGTESGSGFVSNYAFRLKVLGLGRSGFWTAGAPLTSGISKTFSYYDPYSLISYSGRRWELNPVEVRGRTRPAIAPPVLPLPEQQVLGQADILLGDLQAYLRWHNLALIVSRNVTTRDDADHKQPFNLHVFGSTMVTTGTTASIYAVAALQLFQAEQLRGCTGGYGNTARGPGRRVLAEPLHDPQAILANPLDAGPYFSVAVAADGSVAPFAHADRAMTCKLLSPTGVPVVRERFWVTFQPGEVRVCTSCHGINDVDQAHLLAPTTQPQALLQLLAHWKILNNLNQHVFMPAIER